MLVIHYPCCDVDQELIPENSHRIVSVHHCGKSSYDWSDLRTEDQVISDTRTRWMQSIYQ